jgi:hypothetical protein
MKVYRELRQSMACSAILLALHCSVWPSTFANAQSKPRKVAVVKEKDLIPEGIAYDERSKTIFLSSIHKNKIVAIDERGEARDFTRSGEDGLKQVLGMKVYDGKLWACNNTAEHDTSNMEANVHVYDLATGKHFKRYKVSDGKRHLFNDLYFTKSGDVYVTDSDGAGLFVIRKGSDRAEPFIEGGTIPYPNGITATRDEKKLIVSTGGGKGIVSIDLASKVITSIPHAKYFLIGADGLYRHNNNLIAVQNVTFPEAILEMKLSDDEASVTNIRHLVLNIPEFDTPTTGVIVGDEFYFIANSQLSQIIGGGGKIKNPEKLNETVIMKISLN